MEKRAFKDGQVWEKEGMLVQVSSVGGSYLLAAFLNSNGSLSYSGSVIYKDEDSLFSYLDNNGMSLSEKVITLCQKT